MDKLRFIRALLVMLIILIIILSIGAIIKSEIQNIIKSRETKVSLAEQGGKMKLTTVFAHNENIPSEYTCDGQDLAPLLTVSQVPANTKSLVLIVDDPDAPIKTWVHWLVYNLPADTRTIDAKNLPPEAKQGMTDFGRIGWGGPCPPSGTHRYFFKLYAIDTIIDMPAGIDKVQLENAISNHTIEKTELVGLYQRVRY